MKTATQMFNLSLKNDQSIISKREKFEASLSEIYEEMLGKGGVGKYKLIWEKSLPLQVKLFLQTRGYVVRELGTYFEISWGGDAANDDCEDKMGWECYYETI